MNDIIKLVNKYENGVIIMLNELGYCEGEILGFAFYADGEIRIEANYYLETPYVNIGNQHYNSDARVKANYRSALAETIRKGFVYEWCKNSFLLTKKAGIKLNL